MQQPTGKAGHVSNGLPLKEAAANFEKHYLLNALQLHRWHRGKTAATLEISEKTLERKMKQYKLLQSD